MRRVRDVPNKMNYEHCRSFASNRGQMLLLTLHRTALSFSYLMTVSKLGAEVLTTDKSDPLRQVVYELGPVVNTDTSDHDLPWRNGELSGSRCRPPRPRRRRQYDSRVGTNRSLLEP